MSLVQNAETIGFQVSNCHGVWDIYMFIKRHLGDRTQFKHKNHLTSIFILCLEPEGNFILCLFCVRNKVQKFQILKYFRLQIFGLRDAKPRTSVRSVTSVSHLPAHCHLPLQPPTHAPGFTQDCQFLELHTVGVRENHLLNKFLTQAGPCLPGETSESPTLPWCCGWSFYCSTSKGSGQ